MALNTSLLLSWPATLVLFDKCVCFFSLRLFLHFISKSFTPLFFSSSFFEVPPQKCTKSSALEKKKKAPTFLFSPRILREEDSCVCFLYQ